MVTCMAIDKLLMQHPHPSFRYSKSIIRTQNRVRERSKSTVKTTEHRLTMLFLCIYFWVWTLNMFNVLSSCFYYRFWTCKCKGSACCNWKSRQEAWYTLKSIENHTMFSCFQQIPYSPNKADKIQGNVHLVSWHWHWYRNRYSNIIKEL